MNILTRFEGIKRVFLDTAPIIYFVEKDERYLEAVRAVFKRIDEGVLAAVTSPVTLAECLVVPCRQGQTDLVECFGDLIVNSSHTTFFPIDQEIAHSAAELRGRYNLALADAFQIAVCLAAGCDAFFTNDATLKRVKEANVIVLDE
jgi:predicted nucleic acid-binding protein